MNRPVPENTGMPYVSRGRRRRWMVAMYICAAVVVFWVAFGDNHWSVWLSIIPMLVAGIIYFKLVMPIREALTEKADGDLDERQLLVRNRAYFHAFRLLGVMVFGAVLYGALASGQTWPALPMPQTITGFGTLGILVAFLLGSLPAAAAAWFEPDPAPDE